MGFKVTTVYVIYKRSLEKRGDCAVEAQLQQTSSSNKIKDYF